MPRQRYVAVVWYTISSRIVASVAAMPMHAPSGRGVTVPPPLPPQVDLLRVKWSSFYTTAPPRGEAAPHEARPHIVEPRGSRGFAQAVLHCRAGAPRCSGERATQMQKNHQRLSTEDYEPSYIVVHG